MSILVIGMGSAMTVLTPVWSHQVELKASPISASNARSFVSWCLVEHRLLYLVDPVRLVASDLATNALVRAQAAFSVTLSQQDHTVLLTVRDAEALPGHGVARVADTQGRGLNIVDLVSLDSGVDRDADGCRFVWASFALRPGQR